MKGYWETSVGVSVMAYKIRYANWVAGIDPFSPPNYVSTSLINTTETYLTGTLPVRVHYKPKGFDFSMGGVVLFNMNEQIIKKKGTITTHRSETAFRNIDFLQNGNNLLAEIGVGFLFTKNIGLFAKAARGKDFRYLGGSMVFAFSKKEWIVRKHL